MIRGKLCLFSAIVFAAAAASACMKAEKLSTDTNGPEGFLLGEINLGIISLAGASGTACTPTASAIISSGVFRGIPRQMAVDSSGNVYLLDQSNKVWRVTPSVSTATNILSGGYRGLAIDTSINVYTANGTYLYKNGSPNNVPSYPSGQSLAFDTVGNRLFLISPSGTTVRAYNPATFLPGSLSGVVTSSTIFGITYSGGNVYMTTQGANSGIYRWNTVDGSPPVLVAGGGATASDSAHEADGIGAAATFSYPEGITADSAGNLYVTDFGLANANATPPVGGTIRKIYSDGTVKTIYRFDAISGYSGTGIAIDSSGNLFVGQENYPLTTEHNLTKISCASSL